MLIDEFENRGGDWFDEIATDYRSTRERAVSRMAKGSLPPFATVNPDLVDDCGKQAVQLLRTKGAVLKPFASYSDGEFHDALQNMLAKIWQNNAISSDQAVAEFRKLINKEKSRQVSQGQQQASQLED